MVFLKLKVLDLLGLNFYFFSLSKEITLIHRNILSFQMARKALEYGFLSSLWIKMPFVVHCCLDSFCLRGAETVNCLESSFQTYMRRLFWLRS